MTPLIHRFARDERGMLTIEAMLWVPILSFWLIASVAWFDAWLSRNQAAKVAYTLADILSRQEEISEPFLMQLDALQAGLLTRASGFSAMRLSSIQRTSDGHVVRWSCSNDPAWPPLTDGVIPSENLPMMAELDTIVLTELSVPWERFGGIAGLTGTTWSYRVATRPRFAPALEMIGSC